MSVRRYIEGKLMGSPPSVKQPATPWRAALLNAQAQAAQRQNRVARTAPAKSKYGFERIALEGSLVVPYRGIAPALLDDRIRAALASRRRFWPERFTVCRRADGIEVTRTQ